MRRGNGEGSIFKLSGKRRKPWAVRITIGYTNDGKQQYKYIGYFATKIEAKAALRGYLVNPYNLMEKDTTFADVYDRWHKNADLSYSLMRNYKSAFNKCELLHKRKFADITVGELKDQLPNYSPTTKRMYKLLLNHMYKYGMEHEIVDKNLSEFINIKSVESKEKSIFTKDEINKLWSSMDQQPNVDIVLMLLYSGMRIGELLEIKCSDVNIHEGYFMGGLKTEAGKNRIIPIHNKIKPLVEQRLAAGNKHLIASPRGLKIDYGNFTRANGMWHKITTDLGIIHTAHETRHTFVTQMDLIGVNKVALKKIVGHTTKSDITEHYTHKSIKELIDTMNQLEY